jgi:hypothetical protein
MIMGFWENAMKRVSHRENKMAQAHFGCADTKRRMTANATALAFAVCLADLIAGH